MTGSPASPSQQSTVEETQTEMEEEDEERVDSRRDANETKEEEENRTHVPHSYTPATKLECNPRRYSLRRVDDR